MILSPSISPLAVFSTAPMKYAVVESKGLIKTHCCVDMSVSNNKLD